MKFFSASSFLSIAILFLSFRLSAADGTYYRALGLVEEDPLEADALLADTLKNTQSAKVRRAAKYDLFYLRLRLGRFSEAYPLATGKGLRGKFLKAAAAQFHTDEAKLSKVISVIDTECGPTGDAARVGQILAKARSPAAVFDFALQRLEACRVPDTLNLFPVLAKEEQQISDNRIYNIYILKLRTLISAGEYEIVPEAISRIREAAADLLARNAALELPLSLVEARYEAMAGTAEAVATICKNLSARENAAHAVRACLYLKGYSLLKEKKYAEAAKTLNALKAEPREINNRLLKLTAAAASHQVSVTKLKKYIRRSSYRYQAKVLRELSAQVLEAGGEN